MEPFHFKILLFSLSLTFLGLLGTFWSVDDKVNRSAKTAILLFFVFGVLAGIQSIKEEKLNGMAYAVIFVSSFLSFAFSFAKGNGFISWIKFACLINLAIGLTLISI